MVTRLILLSTHWTDLSSGSGRDSFTRAMGRRDLFFSVRGFIAGGLQ